MSRQTKPGNRIRRLTEAALNAESTLDRVDGLANGMSGVLDDLSHVVAHLDPSLDHLDAVLTSLKFELEGISESRADVDKLVAQVGRILDLIEWLLTPAFVARQRLDQLVDSAVVLREALVREVGSLDLLRNLLPRVGASSASPSSSAFQPGARGDDSVAGLTKA